MMAMFQLHARGWNCSYLMMVLLLVLGMAIRVSDAFVDYQEIHDAIELFLELFEANGGREMVEAMQNGTTFDASAFQDVSSTSTSAKIG